MAGENPNDQASGLLESANTKLRESAAVVENLRKENEALKQENEVLADINDELQNKVAELSAPRSLKEAAAKTTQEVKIPSETFEVGGVQYKFIAPVFTHNKTRVAAADALNDQQLLNELVAKGSGLIVPV